MQIDQQSTMNLLVNQPPKVWLAYLHGVEKGKYQAGVSMQVVFHFAAPRARNQLALDWAEVAVRAAELEAHRSGGVERENALTWAMNLRSWFISKVGSRPSDVVLDKEAVIDWITDGLKVPLPTVKQQAASFGEDMAKARLSSNPEDISRATDELRELRKIRVRLNVAKTLADGGQLPAESVLNAWLEVRQQLP